MVQKRVKRKRVPDSPFPLKDLLTRFGLSQRKLALASGIACNYVSRLAQGRIDPRWSTILRIVTTLGGDLGDLKPGPVSDKQRRAKRRRPEPVA